MKKSIFAILLCSFLGIKAQPPVMIVHGSSATKFFVKTGGITQKLFADEIWFSGNDITTVTNISLTSIAAADVYGVPEIEGDLYTPEGYILSCSYAKWLFGKNNVKCGPYNYYGRPVCADVNGVACFVRQTGGGTEILSWSDNGDFGWF